MKRIFCAIKIPFEKQTIEFIDELKSYLLTEKIKWEDYNKIHLTLKFFGKTDEPTINKIIESFTLIAKNHSPFTLKISGIGVFSDFRNPRVIWLGTSSNENLKNLVSDIESSVKDLRFSDIEKEKRDFKAHITIARIKAKLNKIDVLKQFVVQNKEKELQEIVIEEFHLYESILKPEGALHNVIKTFRLEKNNDTEESEKV